MSSNLLEKSLDEIISSKSSSSGGSRSSGPRGHRNRRPRNVSHSIGKSSNSRRPGHRNRQTDSYRPRRSNITNNSVPEEILKLSDGKPFVKVSNLHPELTENDIASLFGKIGPVAFSRILFDTTGTSKEIGYVGYENPEDCNTAIQEFDNKKAAGRIISVSNGIPLAARIGLGGDSIKRGGNPRSSTKREAKPTLEDLDKELDNYQSQNKNDDDMEMDDNRDGEPFAPVE